jgi:hypothetical protein
LETGTVRVRAAFVERSTGEFLPGRLSPGPGAEWPASGRAIIPALREQLTIYVKDEPVALALGSP